MGRGGEWLLELPSLDYEKGMKLRNLDYETNGHQSFSIVVYIQFAEWRKKD